MPTLPLVIDLAMSILVNCTLGGHEGSRAPLTSPPLWLFLSLSECIGVCACMCVGGAFVFVNVCLSGSVCVCVCVCVCDGWGSVLTAAVLF